MPAHSDPSDAQVLQRRRAHRTAWKVGLVAVAVYVGFILTGVLGR
ncbi:MAG: hypothetical protein ACN6RD_11060 [Stenotrophomonas maltophilia]